MRVNRHQPKGAYGSSQWSVLSTMTRSYGGSPGLGT